MTFWQPHELPQRLQCGSKPDRGQDVLVCLWQRRRDDAALAVLANWADHLVEPRLNEKRLQSHFGDCAVFDATTGAPFPQDIIEISVPANAF